MKATVDTRGLSCPQPVLMVMTKMKEGNDELEVMVDNEVSRENVSRAARTQGWEIREERQEGDDCLLYLVKK